MRLKPERIKELTQLLLIIAALVVFSLVVENYMSGRFFSRVTQGVAVTAEGVERPEHLALVRRAGFSHAQGYATGAPVADPMTLIAEPTPPPGGSRRETASLRTA